MQEKTAPLSTEKAEQLLTKHVTTDWLKKHSIASAAVLSELSDILDMDKDTLWVIGLLHDLDFDITQDPSVHGTKSAEILHEHGYPEYVMSAIQSHNAEGLGLERSKPIEHAITCSETITGLIVATALVMPDKKLASVKASSVNKRMKKKDFAKKVNRDRIRECEQIGLEVPVFIERALSGMNKVSDRLEL